MYCLLIFWHPSSTLFRFLHAQLYLLYQLFNLHLIPVSIYFFDHSDRNRHNPHGLNLLRNSLQEMTQNYHYYLQQFFPVFLEFVRVFKYIFLILQTDFGTKEFIIFNAWEITGVIEMVDNQKLLDSSNQVKVV